MADGDTLSRSSSGAIDAICSRFEAEWRAGRRPRIEDYLDQLPETERAGLVRELLLGELECRRRAGETPRSEEYLRRLPAYVPQIGTVFGELGAAVVDQRGDALGETLDSPRPHGAACPGCGTHVPLPAAGAAEDIPCPQCGRTFTIGESKKYATSAAGSSGSIAHFELLESLGTGGFGTVWKARDTQLDRIVAIKTPRQGPLDDTDKQRFLREARAAAQLRHPHIVSVYEVGVEGETIYIVSEFVEGVTLADWLAARRPAPREAAELVVTIAEALDYAHERGVVHRDLKPSNILMDGRQQPYVMDFGLAKREADAVTVTIEGQVMGTPAYMSPEQARGEGAQADRRADIYSLGVILFELLTGERPFRGSLRMLLRQVVEEEPPSPRKFEAGVSRDLETICLKCLEKDRTRRYPTAAALADDLQRHLRHEPITARPLSPFERSWRWCRRHPALVRSLAAVFGTLVVALVLVTRSWRQERVAKDQALDLFQREQAARHEAENNKRLALDRLRDARDAVDTSLTGFSDALQYYPAVQDVRKRILLKAAEDYARFAQQQSQDTDLELERARTYCRLGDVRRLLGESEEAVQAYRSAETLVSSLPAEVHSSIRGRLELATARLKTALVEKDRGRWPEAHRALRDVTDQLRAVVASDPENRRASDTLAAALVDQAVLLAQNGEYEPAERLVREALDRYGQLQTLAPEEPRYREAWARTRSVLGELHTAREQLDDAAQDYEDALAEFGALQQADQEQLDYREAAVTTRLLFAVTLRRQGRELDEQRVYEQTLEDCQLLVARRPEAPLYRQQLALVQSDLGSLLWLTGETQAAEATLTAALQELARLTAEYPEAPDYHDHQAACRSVLGEVYRDLGRTEDAKRLFERVVATYTQLAEQVPDRLVYRARLAVGQGHLGRILASLGAAELARTAFQSAIEESEGLLQLAPEIPNHLNQAAHLYHRRGEFRFALGEKEAAEADLQRAQALWTKTDQTPTPEYLHDHALFLVECVDARQRDPARAKTLAQRAVALAVKNRRYPCLLGAAHYRAGEWAEAVAVLEETLKNLPHGDGRVQFYLALAHRQLGHQEQATTHLARGREWLQEHRPGDPDLQRLQQEAATLIPSAKRP